MARLARECLVSLFNLNGKLAVFGADLVQDGSQSGGSWRVDGTGSFLSVQMKAGQVRFDRLGR